jgi:hypothetical protein
LPLASVIVLAGGCARFKMPVPAGFVQVENERAQMAALTSEEDRLLVGHRSVAHAGDLAFWTTAVRENLVGERGYTLIEEGPFPTSAGLPGHRYLFELSINEVPFRHLLVVFVTDAPWPTWASRAIGVPRQHIYTAEFLAEKKNFDKHLLAVEASLKQFKPRRGSEERTRVGG